MPPVATVVMVVVEGSRMWWLLVLVCTFNRSIFIYLLLLLLFYIGIDVCNKRIDVIFNVLKSSQVKKVGCVANENNEVDE